MTNRPSHKVTTEHHWDPLAGQVCLSMVHNHDNTMVHNHDNTQGRSVYQHWSITMTTHSPSRVLQSTQNLQQYIYKVILYIGTFVKKPNFWLFQQAINCICQCIHCVVNPSHSTQQKPQKCWKCSLIINSFYFLFVKILFAKFIWLIMLNHIFYMFNTQHNFDHFW